MARGRRPLQQARSRPAYSSSGPSWIIVSSRWVSGLSIGWRPVSASTTSAKATRRRTSAPARSRSRRAAAAALIATQVGAVRGQRGESSASTQQRLAEHREREVAGGAHQREAVARVPRRGGEREPGERQQPDEHERVVAERPVRRSARRPARAAGDEQAGRRAAARREAVDEPVRLRVDGALAPQAAQLPVGLQRRRAAAALQARLEVWIEPGSSGASDDAGELQHAGASAAHPSAPSATSASSASTSASR